MAMTQAERARAMAYTFVSTDGKRCASCRRTVKGLHRHHEDYDKPLDVVLLCHRCHSRRHPVTENQKARASTTYDRNLILRVANEKASRRDMWGMDRVADAKAKDVARRLGLTQEIVETAFRIYRRHAGQPPEVGTKEGEA